MESEKKQSKSFGNYGVFFTIAGLYLSGIANIISENEKTFPDTLSPWLGWFIIAAASALLIYTLISNKSSRKP